MNSDTSFGALIKARRVALGMSQVGLAELVGRSASAIRTWERGSSTPTDEGVVRSLSAVLGIDEEDLRETVGLPPTTRHDDEVTGDAPWDALTDDEIPAEGDLDTREPIAIDAESPIANEAEEQEPSEPPTAGDEPDGDQASEEEPDEESVPQGVERGGEESAAPSIVASDDEVTVIEPVVAGVADAPVAATRVVQQPEAPQQRSYLEDPEQMMTYWIRAALTVALTVFLLVVLFWAMGQLGDSLGEVWEVFKSGA